jgi:hypothetical protein
MKKYYTLLAIMFIAASCKSQNQVTYQNASRNLSIVFYTTADSAIQFSSDAGKAAMISYLNTLFSSNHIDSITCAWYDQADSSTKNLVFRCQNKTGGYFLTAISVKAAPVSIYVLEPSGGENHSCAGTNCSCCTFLKMKGKIVGCLCNCGAHPLCFNNCSGTCTHSVTTTQ